MSRDPGCKVDATIDQYGLETADPRHESIHDGLLARWNGTGGHSAVGYRTLTDWFNKRLLKQAYSEVGREASDTQLDAEYEALTDDDSLAREETIDHLAADGIDAEALRCAMVSWGTMRTHLLECLDGEKARPEAQTEWERESVSIARDRFTDTVEEALSSLSTKGELAGVANATAEVQVQLRCDHCPTRVPLEVALERGYVCEQHSDHRHAIQTENV